MITQATKSTGEIKISNANAKITLDDGLTVIDIVGAANLLRRTANELPHIGTTDLFGDVVTADDLQKAISNLADISARYARLFA